MTSESKIEKTKRDYIFSLALMIISYVSIGIIEKAFPSANWWSLNHLFMGITVVVWYVFLYRITSNFYPGKVARTLYASLLISRFAVTAFFQNSQDPISELIVPASISYLLSLVALCIVFYILIKDMFLNKHDLVYSLLVASNIYVMIPLVFSFIYALISVHNPSLVGNPLTIDELLFNCFNYGWFVLAGIIDFPDEKIGELIQSVAVLESLAGNLFIVFIIGRLLSK
jgi:hypothetical protein